MQDYIPFIPTTKVQSVQEVIDCLGKNRRLWTKTFRDINADAIAQMSLAYITYLISNGLLYYFNPDELKKYKLNKNESI